MFFIWIINFAFLLVSALENTYFILSKTEQSSTSMLQKDKCGDNDDLNLMLSTVKLQKSFYNKSERKTSKIFYNQEHLTNDETTYENTVTMDITSNFFTHYTSKNIYVYLLRYFR